jgi:hypothetical protein
MPETASVAERASVVAKLAASVVLEAASVELSVAVSVELRAASVELSVAVSDVTAVVRGMPETTAVSERVSLLCLAIRI